MRLRMNYWYLLFIILLIFTISYYPIHCWKSNKHLLSRKRLPTASLKISESDFTDIPSLQTNDFVPVSLEEIGIEIYLGSFISILPIVWATYEFTSRIKVQRECLLCKGSGLVYVTKEGNELKRPRKCWSCGGFIPWLGWKYFFLSTVFDVGNGGILQRPSKDYNKINEKIKSDTSDS